MSFAIRTLGSIASASITIPSSTDTSLYRPYKRLLIISQIAVAGSLPCAFAGDRGWRIVQNMHIRVTFESGWVAQGR